MMTVAVAEAAEEMVDELINVEIGNEEEEEEVVVVDMIVEMEIDKVVEEGMGIEVAAVVVDTTEAAAVVAGEDDDDRGSTRE